MTLETAAYLNQLNVLYPEETADRLTADDHLRLIKATVKATFPAITGPVTVTPTELNLMVGNTKTVETALARLSATVLTTAISANALGSRSSAAVGDVTTAANSKLHQLTLSICLSETNLQTIITGLPSTLKRLHIHVTNMTTSHPLGAYQRFTLLAGTSTYTPLFPGACAVLTSSGPYDPGFSLAGGCLIPFGVSETETAVFTGSIQMMQYDTNQWSVTVNGSSGDNAATAAVVFGHFDNRGNSVSVGTISFSAPDAGVTFLSGLVRMWGE